MENRVRRNIFILAGISALSLVGIVLAWYFVFLRPQQEKTAKLQADLVARQNIAAQQSQAVVAQRKAEDRLVQLNGQLQFFRKRYRSLYFGDLGSDYASETTLQRSNREAAWRNWMNTYYSGLGPSLSQELVAVADATNVKINTQVLIQAPPKAPEEVAPPANGLLKPVSSSGATRSPSTSASAGAVDTGGSINVEVVGTLPAILNYFSRLNTTQTLMTIGAFKLETVSTVPTLIRATFTATPYLLASGPGALPYAGVISSQSKSGTRIIPVAGASTSITSSTANTATASVTSSATAG